MYPYLTVEKRPLDSPLLRGQMGQAQGPYDGRSPGINRLKEAFDVTYAVHRMEEEGRRRGGRRGVGATGFLSGLNEDEEYGDDDPIVVDDHGQQHRSLKEGRTAQDQGKGTVALASGAGAGHPAPGPAINVNAPKERERHKRGGRRAFELQMDNATLLGRRQNAQRDHIMDGLR
jgi:hypothetical protein